MTISEGPGGICEGYQFSKNTISEGLAISEGLESVGKKKHKKDLVIKSGPKASQMASCPNWAEPSPHYIRIMLRYNAGTPRQ